MIRSVSFDLWETLLTDTPELSRRQERLRLERMERVLVERGFAQTAERIEEAYRSLWHRCLELYWSRDEDIACRVQIEHFLEALEVDPDEMMFVGDNLYVDVHGAQRLGITAVHFDPPRRGTAIAPPFDHGLEIVPHATIRDLRELLDVVDDRSAGVSPAGAAAS